MTQVEVSRFQAVPGFAPATLKLIEYLKNGKPGDAFTADQLAQFAGKRCEPQKSGYSNLQSALRYIHRHHQVFWAWQKLTGIKCLNASEICAVCESVQDKVRRASKRGVRMMNTALSRAGELPDAERPQAIARLTCLMTVAAFADEKALEGIREKKATEPPNMRKMLEQF